MANRPTNHISSNSKIRAEFDRIIAKHLSRLIKIKSGAVSIPVDLLKISCLLLLVERENEIKNFSESPPDRYTRETFLDDLADIGLLVDDDLMVAIQESAQRGYLVLDSNGNFYANRSAISSAAVYDNAFNGMSGLGLVAFALQTIDEVVSERKDLKQALDNFGQALLSRAESSSEQKIPDILKNPNTNTASQKQLNIDSKDKAENFKRLHRERLLKIRSGIPSNLSEPTVLIHSNFTDKVVIKEIFPKSPPKRIDRPEEAVDKVEDKSSPEKNQSDPVESSQKPNLQSQQENHLKNQILEKQRPVPIQTTSKPTPSMMDSTLSNLHQSSPIKETEEQTTTKTSLSPETAATEKKPVTSEHIVEKLIETFEEELTKFCPICGKGKILRCTTEKGKFYYACSDPNCGLISWGKPYHFKCPLCANPFLIEFKYGENLLGLKCPRATCSYYQENLKSPEQESQTNSAAKIQPVRKLLVKSAKKHRKFVKKSMVQRNS